MKSAALNPNKQKRRLRWILLLFFIAPSLPVYYLLQTVYSQLENEAYFTARHQAEKLADELELSLQKLLETEQRRPIAEYSFFNVLENPLLSESSGIKFSPLSVVPPKTDIEGLVGYFQIKTDGSFHLPALPELGQDNISGLSLAELENRLKLKDKLRDLLSIKIPEKRHDKNDLLKESLEKNKAKVVAKNQPYRKEFKQQNIAMDDELAAISPLPSVEGEVDYRAQTASNKNGRYRDSKSNRQTKLLKAGKKYKTRKEIVQLPDQNMASSYFKRSKVKIDSVISEQESFGLALKDNDLGKSESFDTASAINVLSFESEVTPLQLLLIGQDYFCFYRYVWHDGKRYTQGFIVKSHEFLVAITQALINSVDFNSLKFVTTRGLLQKINLGNSQQEYQLYNRHLSMPFQKLELVVIAAKLSAVPGGLLIDLLALSIYCIFLIGFIAFYYLGSRQFDLAKQQQDFISAVSHELKTPLTSIRMYGEMLRSGWVSDENKKQNYYDFIFFESERLSRLINNVLQLARLGHQKQNIEIITTSAQSLLNRISSKIEAQIEASTFELNIVQPVKTIEPIDIEVDEDAFFQIVINLVDNAIKFAKNSDNKQLDIGYESSKNRKEVTFFIRDYGPGIKKDQMKKIFQLFYRSGDELTRTTPGTGIGLALVAQLAETMHASIDVVNKQPGAEFQIKLPVI